MNETWSSHFGKNWKLVTKLNMLLTYNPASVLLSNYTKELKLMPTKTCTEMLLAFLFKIGKA